MKKVYIYFSIIFCFISVALGQHSNEKEVKEILKLLGYVDAYPGVYQRTYDSIKENAAKIPVPKGLEKEYEQLIEEMMAYFAEKASWKVYEDILIDYFNGIYTQEELQLLVEFLRTSAGQKFYTKMPEFGDKFTEITKERMAYTLPEMQKMVVSWMEKHKGKIKTLEQAK